MERLVKKWNLVTWALVFSFVFYILVQGIFTFYVVGDQGQPGWDYRAIKDVPGQSPFAVYQPLPYKQHVKGARGE